MLFAVTAVPLDVTAAFQEFTMAGLPPPRPRNPPGLGGYGSPVGPGDRGAKAVGPLGVDMESGGGGRRSAPRRRSRGSGPDRSRDSGPDRSRGSGNDRGWGG